MTQPSVLMYNFDMDERTRKIRRYLNRTKVRVRMVEAPDYSQPLGVLFELPGYVRVPMFHLSGTFKEEMLVMQGFSQEQLDGLLNLFKEEDIAPVELKAVLTVVNEHWTSIQLHEELMKERAMMEKK